jgi:hypothetical protein
MKQKQLEKAEKMDKMKEIDMAVEVGLIKNGPKNDVSNNLNITTTNTYTSESNEFLQRKKSRKDKNSTIVNSRSNLNSENNIKRSGEILENEIKTGTTVGIKLICDTPNDELKKYFSKTVIIF